MPRALGFYSFGFSPVADSVSTREKKFLQNFISVKDGSEKKGQKQGRDERTQEDYPTSAKNTQQM